MIDDLIDSRVLIDKDSIQVKELLGKPNYKNTNENVWTYEAGTGGGFGFVDHFLKIYYKKNKVQKIEYKKQLFFLNSHKKLCVYVVKTIFL